MVRRMPVYLIDMQEFDVKTGPWPFGKGVVGNPEGTAIRVAGVRSLNGLGMHPPPKGGMARVKYTLGKGMQFFHGSVALDDSTQKAWSPVRFHVWGDGRKLWTSKPVNAPRQKQDWRLDISGIRVLELRATCEGILVGAHAVWIEPRLLRNDYTEPVQTPERKPEADPRPKPTPAPVVDIDRGERRHRDHGRDLGVEARR
jgi:NPCBM/NEW2 domain